jgi:hypothetical protein
MLVKRGGGYVILGTVKILGADELKASADCHLAATWHLLSTCRPHRFGPGAAQVPAALVGPGNNEGGVSSAPNSSPQSGCSCLNTQWPRHVPIEAIITHYVDCSQLKALMTKSTSADLSPH